jgi:NTP pyrophosphatase (non-canonical NTP hydrolase)
VREKHPVYELADKVEEAKGKDYNIGNVRLEDYFIFGMWSHAHMLHWEATRVVSLVGGSQAETLPEIKEHLGDLVNYAKFMWDAVEKEEKRRAEQP